MKFKKMAFLVIGLLMIVVSVITRPQSVEAVGFITFETGIDGETIRSTIPGLEFVTTDGQDWIYGDWTTGNYNGKYPNGTYTSNGDIFAWLGPNQGDGRINFINKDATYLSVWVSANEPVTLTGYFSNGLVADTDRLDTPNVGTGQMAQLTVRAPLGLKMSYVIVSGVANFWLIDDLSTDAGGVPNSRIPIVFVPGVAGSKLENDHDGNGAYDEVWPNIGLLARPGDDSFLLVSRLAENGIDPFSNTQAYTSVRVGDIIRKEGQDVYKSTVEYFTKDRGYTEGNDFIVCPYDWRKDISTTAIGNLNKTLEKCVNEALSKNPNASQVNILAHSMGGMLSKYFISYPNRAQKVKRLITLGTPYLGAPKVALGVLDELCFIDPGVCLSNPSTIHQLLQNFPAAYQLAPSETYFQVYPNGYLIRDRDTDGNGQVDGPLNHDESFALLAGQNNGLAWSARLFHNNVDGWVNGGTNGVEVFMMVGDGIGTPTEIIEYNKTPWYNPSAAGEIRYRIQMDNTTPNGDGTVPLRSADMRHLAESVDLTNGVSVFYFNLDHGDLPKDRTVLQFAADIFETQNDLEPNQNLILPSASETQIQELIRPAVGLSNGSQNLADTYAGAAQPRTTPMQVNGHFITADGPVEFEIVDTSGNRIGFVAGSDEIESNIPGAAYYSLSDTQTVYLPNGSLFTVKVIGKSDAISDIRIQKITSDQLIQTALYDDLPTTPTSTATLDFNPSLSNPGSFALDQDGDGLNEEAYAPSAILTPAETDDIEAPETTINIQGTADGNGWYQGDITVALTAADNPGGTGVAKVEYSLDFGNTVQIYSGPFVVDAEAVHYIMAKATDKAGNEEFPFSTIGSLTLYLPSISR